jgi:hypothetical protein
MYTFPAKGGTINYIEGAPKFLRRAATQSAGREPGVEGSGRNITSIQPVAQDLCSQASEIKGQIHMGVPAIRAADSL